MKKGAILSGYGIVQTQVLKMEIDMRSKLVYCYLASMTGKNDWCWPKITTIQGDLKIAKSAVTKAIKELEGNGLLLIEGLNKNPWVKNRKYQILHLLEDIESIKKGSVEGSTVEPSEVPPKIHRRFRHKTFDGSEGEPSNNKNNLTKIKEQKQEAATPPVAAVALKDETKAVVPGGSFTPAIKTEIDFAWSAMKELKVLPDAKGGRDSLFHAMRMIATRPRYNGHAVEILKQANEYFGRIIKMATNDGGFPLTESRRKGWLIGTFEGAIEASIRYTPKEVIPAIQWALQDAWWKSRFNGFDHLPAVILQYRDGVASGKIK